MPRPDQNSQREVERTVPRFKDEEGGLKGGTIFQRPPSECVIELGLKLRTPDSITPTMLPSSRVCQLSV